MQVCAAVEYAHRNLVVHRDLKAKNILVTEEGCKLLDFGIAKLLDGFGHEPTRLLPAIISLHPTTPVPSRFAPSITTAADIYSLGVLLYEILTEHRPFHLTGMSQAEMARVITEQDPPRPSAVAPREISRELAGDIDTIILKAMHKSPDRRYGTAQALADDIRRHMEGRPVQAHGDSLRYRATEVFPAQSRFRVGSFSCIAGLFVGGIAAAWQRGVAISKEQEARKRFGDIRSWRTRSWGNSTPNWSGCQDLPRHARCSRAGCSSIWISSLRTRCETPHYSANSQSHTND